MSDREAKLRELTAELYEHEAVADAFLAKILTNRFLIVDIDDSDGVPDEVKAQLTKYDHCGADDVYGNDKR